MVAVAAHGLLSWPYPWLNPYVDLQVDNKATASTAVVIYLGTSGAAAVLAGLAGVILVFVVGSPSPRVRNFRYAAGKPLHASWTSVVTESFAATILGIIAAVTQTTSGLVNVQAWG
jgi:hypothetical protein